LIDCKKAYQIVSVRFFNYFVKKIEKNSTAFYKPCVYLTKNNFMQGRYNSFIKFIHLAGDLFFLNLSYILAFYLRFDTWDILDESTYRARLLIFNICWFIIIYIYDIYAIHRTTHINKVISNVVNSILTHLLLLLAAYYLIFKFTPSRLQLGYAYSFLLISIIAWRAFVIWNLKVYRARGKNFKNVVFIGNNTIESDLVRYFVGHKTLGYKIRFFFDNNPTSYLYKKQQVPVLPIDYVFDYCENNMIDEMYIQLDNIDKNELNEIIRYAEKNMIRIRFLPMFSKYILRKVHLEFYDHIPILILHREPLEHPLNRLQKRFFDIVFSLFFLLTVFPFVFVVVGFIIKLTSKGPIFFIQKRTGQDNKEFSCYKFRTMEVNQQSDELQAVKNDPRLTKIGKILRKTNIDELPQFVNVLLGHMSVVGPRPHMLKHTEQYSLLIDKYMVRHYVKPGITGWAQINGLRGETKTLDEMERRIKADIWYMENWSLGLDAKIIVKTTLNAMKGDKKAY